MLIQRSYQQKGQTKLPKTIKTCFNYNDNDNDLDDEDQETTACVQMNIQNIANESISAATDVIMTEYPEDLRIRLGLD